LGSCFFIGRTEALATTSVTAGKHHVHFLKFHFFIGRLYIDGDHGGFLGGQFGIAPFPQMPLYIALEGNFAFYSEDRTASFTNTLFGGWYEFSLFDKKKRDGFVGILGGFGYISREGSPPASQFPNMADQYAIFFLEVGATTEVSEVAQVRGQLRPGLIDGNFALALNASFQFRWF